MRILDSHIHLYPPEVFADPVAWGTAQGEPWWTCCVAPPHQPTLQGWADVGTLLRAMDRAGVEQGVMLGWYWERQETCELQNGWFIDWVRQHPDRLRGFATVQPNSGQRGLDNVRAALDAGLCGIGELLPQAQGFRFTDEAWARLVALAVERRVPINLHVTDPVAVGAGAGVKATPLEDYVRLTRDFPAATFILAHWGGGLPFYELNPRIRAAFRNVYYDTAASPLLYDPGVFRRVVDLIGAERILFGTDYPLLCFPRQTREPEFGRHLAEVAAAGLTEAERAAILGGNLLRLLAGRSDQPGAAESAGR
jgi:predicted TIM-barrel fold metal-dependent hydrolase